MLKKIECERRVRSTKCSKGKTERHLYQRGPKTFDLRVILKKRDNLRTASDKMKYEITASQDFKLKKGR